MSILVKETQKELRARIIDALGRAVANGELPAEPIPDFIIEKPANSKTATFPLTLRLQEQKLLNAHPEKLQKALSAILTLTELFLTNAR